MSDVLKLIGEANQSRRRVIDAAAGLSSEQEQFRLGPDEWTVPQVIEYLVLAEMMGISGLWAVVRSVGQGEEAWDGELPNPGRSIDEIVAATVTGKIEALEAVKPRFNGPLDWAVAELEACQPVLASFGAALHGLDPETIIFPHFVFGPLDAVQRLQFLRWHLDHHLEQIEEIKAALPG